MQVGPELELPGYGCEDHFQELDTVEHCWECIAGIHHQRQALLTKPPESKHMQATLTLHPNSRRYSRQPAHVNAIWQTS